MKLSDKAFSEDNSLSEAASVLMALGPEVSSEVLKYLSDDEKEKLLKRISDIKAGSARNSESAVSDFVRLSSSEKNREFGQPFGFLRNTDPLIIFSVLKNELPQTIALVLSYVPQETASEVLSGFSPSVREKVVRCIDEKGNISTEILEAVENSVKKAVGAVY